MKLLTIKIHNEKLSEVLTAISPYVEDLTVTTVVAGHSAQKSRAKTTSTKLGHRNQGERSCDHILEMLKVGPQRQSKITQMLTDKGFQAQTASATLSTLRSQSLIEHSKPYKRGEDTIWRLVQSNPQ